ncbi:MAG: hypothetical protein ABI353_04500 [Isosphaeraceae bacterium]
MARMLAWACILMLTLGTVVVAAPADEVPAPFASFNYLLGGWKGSGIPEANRVRGWPEKHNWAWKFAKGTPVGMTVVLEGDKVLTNGELSYDDASKTYHLNAQGADGKPLAYQGTLDSTGKTLTLDREGTSAEGKERIILRPNSSKIRYTMVIERQPPGAPQYSRFIEVGVTKEGEAFAAGGNTANLPKCVITGGSATMTVSFQGKTFPICCTGCRDEFNDNPDKYVQKAMLKAKASDGKTAAKPASSGKDDGAFDGLLIGEPKKAKPAPPKAKTETKSAPAEAEANDEADTPETQAPAKPAEVSKAASLLTQAYAFERSRKASAAVIYYRRIVKEYPDTPEAKTAAERIKTLAGK